MSIIVETSEQISQCDNITLDMITVLRQLGNMIQSNSENELIYEAWKILYQQFQERVVLLSKKN